MLSTSQLKKKLSEKKEFVVTCEFVPGRGSKGRSVEEAIEFGKKVVSSNLPIHAISITDNPGGNPAISPDVLGKELHSMGLEALIHFACRDCNRNMIESRAYALARNGVENLLVITGDYPNSGYGGRAKPNFDLDSVQLIKYLKEMNEGLKIPGRKKGTFDTLPKTDFFIGCVVSPFKTTEAELMTQFFKLEKKVKAGADFIIPQLGYDVTKFAEVLKYMEYKNIDIPILGNVYVLNKGVAGFMNKGNVPGCVVTDELLKKIEKEAESADKGKKASLDRAAQLTAIFKGLNFNGVHIGGFGLQFEDFEYIIKMSEKLEHNWRDFIPNFRYNQKDEFYCFPNDPNLTFKEEKPVPVELPRKHAKPLNFQLSRIFHRLIFTEGAMGYKIAKFKYSIFEKWKSGGKMAYAFEKTMKRTLFDCKECGDCGLFDLAYVCPMSKCAKSQRNGPCGGSKDGMCEVDNKKKCAWTMVYDRLSSTGKLDQLCTGYVPPVDGSLQDTSSWANFYLGRDHTGKKLKEEKKQSE